MNKEVSVTFGGRSLMDEVNHVCLCLFHVSPHDVLLPSLCIMFKCLLFPSCTYEPAGKMDCSTVKEKGSKNVIFIIMFHCTHTKSFSGHYDDVMLVSVNNAGVYIKENCRIIVFQCTWFLT